jgi:hypothetical protein
MAEEWQDLKANKLDSSKDEWTDLSGASPTPVVNKKSGGILESLGTGAMKGLSDIYAGGLQLAGYTGLISPEYTKKFEAERKADIEKYKPLLETTSGKIGEFGGQMAATLPIGGGVAGPLVQRIGTSMLASGAVGALQPTETGNERLKNVLIGAGIGGLAQGAVSGVSKLINTAIGKLSPKAQEITDLSNKFGIRTTLGETTDNALTKKSETWLESVPIIGLKGFRQKQQDEAQQATKGFFSKYVVDPTLDSTTAMKEANDIYLDTLYESVKKSGKKLASVEATQVKQATDDLLVNYPGVFSSIQDSRIKKILTNVSGDVSDQVSQTGVVITPTFSFNDLWTLRKGLGQEIRDAQTDTAKGALKNIYGAVSNDMETMFQKSNPALSKDFKFANDEFKRVSVKFDVLRQAYDKASGTTGAGEMFSPKKFSTELKNLANNPNYKKNVKWEPGEVEEMTGLANILQVVRRAGQYAENPPTGNRWGGPVLGAAIEGAGYIAGGGPGALKTAAVMTGVAGIARFLTGTESGKRLAMAASKLEPTNPAMNRIVEQVYRQVPKISAIEATKNSKEK